MRAISVGPNGPVFDRPPKPSGRVSRGSHWPRPPVQAAIVEPASAPVEPEPIEEQEHAE